MKLLTYIHTILLYYFDLDTLVKLLTYIIYNINFRLFPLKLIRFKSRKSYLLARAKLFH